MVRQGLAEVYRGRHPYGFDSSPYRQAEGAAPGNGAGKVVRHDDLMAESRCLSDRLCELAPLVVRTTKEIAVRTRNLPCVEAVRLGETKRIVVGGTADVAEAKAAGPSPPIDLSA